jgi:branched-chain amino acid transport system permease protein
MPLATFADFMQQIVSGLASGSIYASLALALVIIHRSTGVINFAQGEMATFSAYILWALIAHHGWSYWPGFVAALLLSFLGGVFLHTVVIRPVESGSVLRIVIVTIGLLLAINGLIVYIWGGEPQRLESPFGSRVFTVGGVSVAAQEIGTLVVALGTVVVLWALFRFTKLGLAMRAAAVNPSEARLVGVRVTWMLGLGWGLAAVLGAISGILTAPLVASLDPQMMQAILIYAFAAAVLGGIDSPLGAVVGGLLLGIVLNVTGVYVGFIGTDLKLPVALAIILVVLLIKPSGLFGKPEVKRV